MKYSVKMVVRHTVDTGEVFLEESILMLEASSFDNAYSKAEQYVKDYEINCTYENMLGKRVQSKVVSFADCFSVYDDDDVVEVYSSIRKCSDGLCEDTLMKFFENSCSRQEMLPLRQWPDPDFSDETDID